MTQPPNGPPPDSPGAEEDVALLEAELASGDGGRLVRYSARANTVVRLLAAVICAVGVVALLMGLAAWRSSPVAMVVIALLCAPAVLLPIYVVRRTGALAEAAAHPREVAAQAHQLVGRVRDSRDLQTLARTVRSRGDADGRGGRRLGLRRAVTVARSASAVVGQAQPDPDHQPLLVAFTPDRLAKTWSAAIWSLWGLLLALAVLVVSIPVLIISFF